MDFHPLIKVFTFYLVMKVIVLWTATTERFTSIEIGLNDTADNLLASIHVSTDQTISIFSFISFDVVSLKICNADSIFSLIS